jgi:hypothetical protein
MAEISEQFKALSNPRHFVDELVTQVAQPVHANQQAKKLGNQHTSLDCRPADRPNACVFTIRARRSSVMPVAMPMTVTVSMSMMPMMPPQEAEDAMAMPAMPDLLDQAAFTMGGDGTSRDDRRRLRGHSKQPER